MPEIISGELLIQYYDKTVSRFNNYKCIGKSTKIIDISLYRIFAKSDLEADVYFKEKIDFHVKNIRSAVTKNPDLLKMASLASHINKYGEIKGLEIYNKFISLQKSKSKRSIDYYTHLGLTEEYAKIEISKIQNNFSLEKCIKNYGLIEGELKWSERQRKWQNTLKSKSKEEILCMNSKKSWRKDFDLPEKWSTKVTEENKDLVHYLYYIKFSDLSSSKVFYKIGITKFDDLSKRFKPLSVFKNLNNHSYDVIFNIKTTFQMAVNLEKNILSTFIDNRIKIRLPKFSTTESFDKDILMQIPHTMEDIESFIIQHNINNCVGV